MAGAQDAGAGRDAGAVPVISSLGARLRLDQGLALSTGPLATNVLLHREYTRCVVQPLSNIFADAL